MKGKPYLIVTKKVKKRFLQNCLNEWVDTGVFQVTDHFDTKMKTINSPQKKYS